ncbi:longevity assurance proteins LAG1/LAC1 [Thozetella sp. PMI_491]|nr:longevity assurance proteins LAG1/LAC1 [Thozetella sp. PMI_491]
MADTEPFPVINTSAHSQPAEGGNAARRRRQSSGLGTELLVGDTGTPGLATSLAHLNGASLAKDSKDAPSPSSPSSAQSKRFSKRRKARSIQRRVKSFAIKHTWVFPLVILFGFLSLYALNPTPSNPIHHFIFLAYELPPNAPGEPPQYGKGMWDVAFVVFYIVVLSFTREFIMLELLQPLARYSGLKSRGKRARFAEQMYQAIYFGLLGPAGVYVMSRTPVWFFNTTGMYENFPHRTHEAAFKFYYLFQAAFWAQQAIVLLLGMEKPRKDYKELVGHHIVSLMLIGLSYRFHFTYIGLAVYITHDISDFFLATSKSLNYVDHFLTAPYYFLFMVVWIYLRHFLNLRILWSLLTEFRTVGPYELNWETEQYKCLLSNVITFTLLAMLQALNLFWLFFILRIAYRVAVHNVIEDDRSEPESDVEQDDAKEKEPVGGNEVTPLLQNGKAKAATNGAAKKAAQ